MNDVVYFVKEGISNRELRYSLRSLRNFPHRKVWFYGGCPYYIHPDCHVKVMQPSRNKWLNVRWMIELACGNENISNDFWLFNDDFFIMQKVTQPEIYYNGSLRKRIQSLEDYYGYATKYSMQLRSCLKELERLSLNDKNFELHTPFKVNKKKALDLLNITAVGGFRSLYGNYYGIKAKPHSDVKITSLEQLYHEGEYLSTDNKSFGIGKVGYQIRKRFPDKCNYEK